MIDVADRSNVKMRLATVKSDTSKLSDCRRGVQKTDKRMILNFAGEAFPTLPAGAAAALCFRVRTARREAKLAFFPNTLCMIAPDIVLYGQQQEDVCR